MAMSKFKSGPLGIAGRLTKAFIASSLTPLFILAALAAGLVALGALPREEEPQISVPMVDIHVMAPGLKAEDAVKLVTEPLEVIVKGINGVEHVYSNTRDDGALVMARFAVGTKAEVAKTDDVGLTYLVGAANEVIRIAPDPDRLALYGVTLQQLAGKVAQANRTLNTGKLRDQGQEIDLVAGGTLTAPAEVANLLLTTRDGRPVYVADVADVSFVADTSAHMVAHSERAEDGSVTRSPAVTLAVAKRAGANAVVVAEAALHRIEAVEGSIIPDSVKLTITRDYGETANEKANELLFHLGLATVSIIALVFLAIGWREAMVVAIVIPVTILLTLFAAWIMGYTLNRVSLFALIFSIGILVDDAIVVIENIARHWAMKDGRGRAEAAIDAVSEVGTPTIVATLTVVAALLPMLFVSGLMGPYMSPIPANASAAMIFSFFVAVIITPWLMVKIAGKADMSAHGHDDTYGGHDAKQGGWMERAYQAVATPLLATKKRSLMFLIISAVLSFGSLGLLGTKDVTVKLLPFDNKSELSVMIDLPEDASTEATDRVAQDVAAIAMELEEVTSIQTHSGTAAPFNFNGLVRHTYLRQEAQLGEVAINLTPKGERDRSSHDIALDLRARLQAVVAPVGTSIKVVEPPPGPPVISTLLAEVYGPDAASRRAAAKLVEDAFRSVPFIVDVDNSYGEQARRLRATISTDDLEFFGVQEQDVFDTMALLNSGQTVGYSHRGEGRYPIPLMIQRAKGDRVLDERFLTPPIPANTLPGARGVVELGDVVRISEEAASFPIFRHNGRAAEMVTGELAGAFEAPLYGMLAVADALKGVEGAPEISLHGQPDDETKTTLLWDGEWEVTWVTFRDMGAAFGVALLGIYILVVAQFGSFKLPLVILTPIPLTFLGIMAGHWLCGAPFSATSMIGFIALAGIIVRNSILLVDFIRGEGAVTVESLIRAGTIRFKPIFLTAVAAMIGAVVILTDPIFQGLAISLLFGLLTSTLLTVLVIPAIYRVFRT